MLNALDVTFRTDRFNLSVVKPEFINDCCFGDDLGRWLKDALAQTGLTVTGPDQEDWGWYLETFLEGIPYTLSIGGNPDGKGSSPNHGEWRIVVERKKSMKERFSSKGQIHREDVMLLRVLEICSKQSDFENVRAEAG